MQIRSGYESDMWRLAILELATGQVEYPDRKVSTDGSTYTWSPDSHCIFFTVEDHGHAPLLMVPAAGGPVRTIAQGPTTIDDVQFTPDGKTMIYSEQSGSKPLEISKSHVPAAWSRRAAHASQRWSDQRLPVDRSLKPSPSMRRRQQSRKLCRKAAGVSIRIRKYPALLLIHGGPQGAWGESWSYRWNAQVFAARATSW